MIDIISIPELDRLANAKGGPCVSIYLPTRHVGETRDQDRIRLKNALTQANRELIELGLRGPEANALLAPIASTPDDHDFWNHLEDGLVAFARPGEAWRCRLATTVEELVVVADRFHIKPLVPLVSTGAVFHVLALSQKHVRLLQGSRYQVSEIALEDVPHSLDEALRYDDRERQLQSHSADRVGRGQVSATFHGQGAGAETDKADLERFLSVVDAGVRQLIGSAVTPLVLAGVGSTVARFRHISRYPLIVEGSIDGDPAKASNAELHDRAWPLVEPVFHRARERARTIIEGGATATATTIADALRAAHSGLVEAAFVPVGVHRWGVFDTDRWEIHEHDERRPGDRDLLDAIAVATLEHRGELHVVEPDAVPGGGLVAAELRYRQ